MTDLSPTWDPAARGVVELPSGRLVRCRGLRSPLPEDAPPELGVYLLGSPPPAVPWDSRWIRWPDFRLPADLDAAQEVLREAWERAADVRVEVDHEKGADGSHVMHRRIELVGDLTGEQREYLLGIANKCPVHKTLSGKIDIDTALI